MDSPCNRVCQLDADDVCIGCGRTRGEIAEWLNASPERQAKIIQAAEERLRSLDPRLKERSQGGVRM